MGMNRILILITVSILFITGCVNKEDTDEQKAGNKAASELEGYWEGTIDVPDQPLNINIEFNKEEEWSGTISIPIQNVDRFSLSEIDVNGGKVSFQMPVPGQSIRFDGKMGEDELNGTFNQAGQSFPFSLKKSDEIKEETGKGDFLSIETSTGTLYGELLLPEGKESAPVALIIPGSGPTDRNGNSQSSPGKNDSLKLLAEGLAAQGIASLRYDKRGAGKNAEAVVDEKEMRFDIFIDDAKNWLELLESDKRFTDIAVIGHSQGSLVGMMAAGPETTEAFISIAGAGRPIDQVLEEQLEQSLSEDLLSESRALLENLRSGKEVSEVSEPLMGLFAPDVQPFLRSWMAYDPSEQLQELNVPTLLINGGHDLQVPVEDAKLMNEVSVNKSEILIIEDMNHVLKQAPENREENLSTYTDPDLPLAERLVEGIIDFLAENDFN